MHGPLCNNWMDWPSPRAALALSKKQMFKNIPASPQTILSVSGHPFTAEQTPFFKQIMIFKLRINFEMPIFTKKY